MMDTITTLQWGLFAAYLTLFSISAITFARRPQLRSIAFLCAFIALPHIAFYITLLILPDWLDELETMMLSIAIRYQIIFTASLLLALAVRKESSRQ